jgi:hypothetical protein
MELIITVTRDTPERDVSSGIQEMDAAAATLGKDSAVPIRRERDSNPWGC